MKTKHLFTLLFILLAWNGFSQTIKNGEVVAVVPLASQAYSIINETGTANYYKTSPHTMGELTQGQTVELWFNVNRFDPAAVQVVTPTLSANLFSLLVQATPTSSTLTQLMGELPLVKDSILFFKDSLQLVIFYDVLNSMINNSSLEMSEVLDNVELEFPGFLSYRTWFNQEYNWLNGSFSQMEIDRISQIDFINDEIEKLMYNSHRMIGLKDSIYYRQGPNVFVAIHEDYSRGITTLANLPDDYDIFGHVSGILKDSSMKVISPLFQPGVGTKAKVVISPILKYTSEPSVFNVPCDAYKKKLKVVLWEYYTPVGATEITTYSGTITINWGDGSPLQTITGYEGQWVEHTYATLGTKFPKTTCTITDMNGNPQTLIDGNYTDGQDIEIIVANSCTDQDFSRYDTEISGVWMMTNKLWVEHNVIFKRIGSYTHAWKYDGGSWSKHKADIYASVDGIFRDTDCYFKKHETGSDLEHLQKMVQATKIKLFKHYSIMNGDVKSRHYMVKGSLFMELWIILNPC